MIQRLGRLLVAVALLVGGILALLSNLGIIGGDVYKFWPLILVVLGVIFLYEYLVDYRKPGSQGGNGLFG
jgi:hypothetical protein